MQCGKPLLSRDPLGNTYVPVVAFFTTLPFFFILVDLTVQRIIHSYNLNEDFFIFLFADAQHFNSESSGANRPFILFDIFSCFLTIEVTYKNKTGDKCQKF